MESGTFLLQYLQGTAGLAAALRRWTQMFLAGLSIPASLGSRAFALMIRTRSKPKAMP